MIIKQYNELSEIISDLAAKIEMAFDGVDFSNVKLIVNSEKAFSLGVIAYASRDEIHFAPGYYDPLSLTFQKVLIHELVHIVQQRQGRVRPLVTMSGMHINDDLALEHEANDIADYIINTPIDQIFLPKNDIIYDVTNYAGNVIQCIVTIISKDDKKPRIILPKDFDKFVNFCRARAINLLNIYWDQNSEELLLKCLGSREIKYNAENIDSLLHSLFSKEPIEKGVGVTRESITADDLKKGHTRRSRQRFSSLLETCFVQSCDTVPGVANVPEQELPRLDDHGQSERYFWVKMKPKLLKIFKKRGVSKQDEPRIMLCGDRNDPSIEVFSNNHHLAHRYKGMNKSQVKKGHRRTYGSKTKVQKEICKVTGATDGHVIQFQDDQIILSPYKPDCPHWDISISEEGKEERKVDCSQFLPSGSADTSKTAEEHPYNYYLENKEQGKHYRQALEKDALGGNSFTAYMVYDGQTAKTNGKKKITVPIPSRVEYLVPKKGQYEHFSADNRLEADYSNPSMYNEHTHMYPSVPGGVLSKEHNKSLGGKKVKDHLEKSRLHDTSQYPFATVLHPDSEGFEFDPSWKSDYGGRVSPAPSPCNIPELIESGIELKQDIDLLDNPEGILPESIIPESSNKISKYSKIRCLPPEKWIDVDIANFEDVPEEYDQLCELSTKLLGAEYISDEFGEFKKRVEEKIDAIDALDDFNEIIQNDIPDDFDSLEDLQYKLSNFEDFSIDNLSEDMQDEFYELKEDVDDKILTIEYGIEKVNKVILKNVPNDFYELIKINEELERLKETICIDNLPSKLRDNFYDFDFRVEDKIMDYNEVIKQSDELMEQDFNDLELKRLERLMEELIGFEADYGNDLPSNEMEQFVKFKEQTADRIRFLKNVAARITEFLQLELPSEKSELENINKQLIQIREYVKYIPSEKENFRKIKNKVNDLLTENDASLVKLLSTQKQTSATGPQPIGKIL